MLSFCVEMALKEWHSELFCRVTFFSCHVHAGTNLQNVPVVSTKSFILGSSSYMQLLVLSSY